MMTTGVRSRITLLVVSSNPRIGREFTDAGFGSIDLSSLYFHEWLNTSRIQTFHQSKNGT
jgi:hypothetical protein